MHRRQHSIETAQQQRSNLKSHLSDNDESTRLQSPSVLYRTVPHSTVILLSTHTTLKLLSTVCLNVITATAYCKCASRASRAETFVVFHAPPTTTRPRHTLAPTPGHRRGPSRASRRMQARRPRQHARAASRQNPTQAAQPGGHTGRRSRPARRGGPYTSSPACSHAAGEKSTGRAAALADTRARRGCSSCRMPGVPYAPRSWHGGSQPPGLRRVRLRAVRPPWEHGARRTAKMRRAAAATERAPE